MQTITEDIKNKSFKPVYLLFGEESFLKKSYKNQLRDVITGDDTMNYNYYEGKGLDVKELISLADTMPFFSDKRLIVVEDSGFFKSAQEELAAYLPAMPETTCLVFVEDSVDKRGKMYKRVGEVGHAAEMKRQDTAHLAKWAAGILAKNGKKITGSDMEFFLERTGDDMENIRAELDKLISYTLGREIIARQDMVEITTERVSNQIFEMVTFIVTRKIRRAMELYEDLLALKEPPMRILFLIARQFNQLLQVRELCDRGADKASVASKLKLSPFIASKLMAQAKNFRREQILAYVTTCVMAEEAVKTGRLNDRLAVEMLIVEERK